MYNNQHLSYFIWGGPKRVPEPDPRKKKHREKKNTTRTFIWKHTKYPKNETSKGFIHDENPFGKLHHQKPVTSNTLPPPSSGLPPSISATPNAREQNHTRTRTIFGGNSKRLFRTGNTANDEDWEWDVVLMLSSVSLIVNARCRTAHT